MRLLLKIAKLKRKIEQLEIKKIKKENKKYEKKDWNKILKEHPNRTNCGGFGLDGQWYEC